MTVNKIFANWCISNNIGDALNVWLIEKLIGSNPIYVERNEYCSKYMFIGSILDWADRRTIVWGAGIANGGDNIDPKVDIRAVRGPISRNKALFCGAECPEVYGDPSLLLPRFFNPVVEPKYELGIIPHYVDQFNVQNSQLSQQENIKIINVFDSVEHFILQVKSCKKILSSSLHGLIISDAYGVPSKWFEASNKVGGDGTKFHDYFLSVGYEIYNPLKWYELIYENVDTICSKIEVNKINIDLEKLYNACPLLSK